MARPLRIEYAGALYHITARGNERKRIYFTNSAVAKVYYRLSKAVEENTTLRKKVGKIISALS